MKGYDWNDLRYFIELVRNGNPMAAARTLKADHTTVRRRIVALEDALQTKLLSTREQPLKLTAAGAKVLAYAEDMERIANQLGEEVTGQDARVAGTVRIGAPDAFATWFLTPRLRGLLEQHSELKIELVAVPREFNLTKREADIAIALSPPRQNRQIVQKLTSTKLVLGAAREYLDRRPLASLSDLKNHILITYISDLVYTSELDYLHSINVDYGRTFETTSLMAQYTAAANGIGVAILPRYFFSERSRLVSLFEDEFALERDIWLVVHPDLVKLARVRTVVDFIKHEVGKERDSF